MKQRLYLETSIVSYLAARPAGDLVLAARQHITWQWWEYRKSAFDVHISQAVVDEAGDGDPQAAMRRLTLLGGLPRLETSPAAVELGESLVQGGLLPRKAATDALHVAVATVHEMDLLLTWNCKHLANGEIVGALARAMRSRGFELPVICTPDELMGE